MAQMDQVVMTKILDLMLEKQSELNAMILPGWKNTGIPWHRAIWMECAELLDSLPWKWWAKENNPTDKNNIKIELVDIWHFVLSYTIDTDREEEFLCLFPLFLQSCKRAHPFSPVKKVSPQLRIEKLVYSALQGDLIKIWHNFAVLMALFGLEFEELAKIYFGKYVLNHFRQENGIRQGKYKRNWNGKEDNQVMFEIIKELDIFPFEDFEKKLKQKLLEKYKKVSN